MNVRRRGRGKGKRVIGERLTQNERNKETEKESDGVLNVDIYANHYANVGHR